MAAVDPFYLDLYRRGMTLYEAGDWATASRDLRLAAFGFVEALEQFETAHVYAAIAATKAGKTEDARQSVERILAAERVTRTYPHLVLPSPVRAEFDVIAKGILAANEYAFLTSNAPPPPRPTPKVVVMSTPSATTPSTATESDRQRQHQPPSGSADGDGSSSKPAARTSQPATAGPQPATPAAHSVTPAPQPVTPAVQPVTPAPQPVTPAPQPARSSPRPATPAPVPAAPVPQPPAKSASGNSGDAAASRPVDQGRQVTTTAPPPAPSTPHTTSRSSEPVPGPVGSLADAERAVASGDLVRARAIYGALLETPQLAHGDLLKIGEGLYRSRDFRGAVRAFTRAGTFKQGEEPFRYYLAVSLYESGQYAAAKRELGAALPFVERTPDVERYRAKIEGAIE